MSTTRWLRGAAVAAGLATLASCTATTTGPSGTVDRLSPSPLPSPVTLPSQIPTPVPDPADFVEVIDNPYLPLAPGNRWVYEVTTEDGEEQIVVTVTDKTLEVAGVTTTVVHDRVTTAAGELVEDTDDWYAQDTAGNVWYFGEATIAYPKGKPTTRGSWEAGVDGAQAGLVMPAVPEKGQAYAQEYYADEAEDRAEVVAVGGSVAVPAGRYDEVVTTEDSTPLEPELLEHKFYAPGVGVVMEEDVRGGDEVVRLVRFSTSVR